MSHVLHCLRPAQFCVELSSRREADDANMERGDLHCIEGAFSKKSSDQARYYWDFSYGSK